MHMHMGMHISSIIMAPFFLIVLLLSSKGMGAL